MLKLLLDNCFFQTIGHFDKKELRPMEDHGSKNNMPGMSAARLGYDQFWGGKFKVKKQQEEDLWE